MLASSVAPARVFAEDQLEGRAEMRFRLRNVLIVGVGYLVVAVMLAQESMVPLLVAIAYAGGCMLLTRHMISKAEAETAEQTIEFFQSNPLYRDQLWGSFHHAFVSDRGVVQALLKNLSDSLNSKLGCSELKQIILKDIDTELPAPESRAFLRAVAPLTARKTLITFLCVFSRIANVQGLRWWILVRGQRDPNAVFWRYALSPIKIPLVLWSYLTNKYRADAGFNKINPGFFNSNDVSSRVREIQLVAFNTLVETLDTFGIDTTDLKQQKANILNINVSGGGQTSFGNVVQGAMNKVMGSVEAA
jgi:hypothetical protein